LGAPPCALAKLHRVCKTLFEFSYTTVFLILCLWQQIPLLL